MEAQADGQLPGHPLPLQTDLGGYLVEGVISRGGFGITYLALDTRLERRVVIKEHYPIGLCERRQDGSLAPFPGMEDWYARSLDLFCREAGIQASLNLPGIAVLHDIFRALGTVYGVMEYVEGTGLETWLAQPGNRNEAAAAAVLRSLLDTLTQLHGRQIYHRDIKPANIVITPQGKPVLLDFGAAMVGTPEHSFTIMGTAGFAPPEQLSGKGPIGPWTDLYALGQSLRATLGKDVLASFSRRFNKALEKATSTIPEARFATAAAWQQALGYRRGPANPRRMLLPGAAVLAAAGAYALLCPRTPPQEQQPPPQEQQPPPQEQQSPPQESRAAGEDAYAQIKQTALQQAAEGTFAMRQDMAGYKLCMLAQRTGLYRMDLEPTPDLTYEKAYDSIRNTMAAARPGGEAMLPPLAELRFSKDNQLAPGTPGYYLPGDGTYYCGRLAHNAAYIDIRTTDRDIYTLFLEFSHPGSNCGKLHLYAPAYDRLLTDIPFAIIRETGDN